MDTVLFDGDCSLCRSLAGFLDQRIGPEIQLISWQSHYFEQKNLIKKEAEVPVLRVILAEDGTCLDNDLAWTYLLEHIPALAPFHWLAKQLGLTQSAAKAMHHGGAMLRKFCRGCSPTIIK